MNREQAKLNGQHGGSGTIGRNKTVSIPQFNPPGGLEVSPVNSNSSSVAGNETSIIATNNASNDCWATNSCGAANGGGKRKRTNRKRTNKKRTNKKRTNRKRTNRKRRYL